jgi:DHA1 family bicyclomycin/chloramphenicol resistance-like MFS transporter
LTFDTHGHRFTVFLAALSALPPLAIDMALPSLTLVQTEFGASQTQSASAIAIFLAGFSTAPLAIGPFADRFGRRPVMLAGLMLFALCGAGCAFAPSIGALLAFRLFQGVGAGAVGVLPRAIIRDLFEGRESRLLITTVSLVQGVAPVIAPSLGAAVLAVAPWRAIYGALAAIGALLFALGLVQFQESQARETRQSLEPAAIVANYRRALRTRLCVGFALVNGLVFAGMFAYINTSPLLFIQGFGVSKAAFAGLFALTAFGVIIGTGANAWLVRRQVRPKSVRDVALTLVALSAVALLAVSVAGLGSTFVVVGIVLVYISSFGLIFPNASHEAVQPLPDIAGVASAILLSAQMLLGALGGALGAAFYRDASPLGIGLVMSVSALAAAALYAFWLRPSIEA